MKNIMYCLITALFPTGIFAQKVKMIDVKNSEIAVIVDIKKDGTFSNYYVFQYQNNDFKALVKCKNIKLIQATSSLITLNCDNKIISLSIDKSYVRKREKVYYGYGLAKYYGNFKLKENVLNPESCNDWILNIVKAD